MTHVGVVKSREYVQKQHLNVRDSINSMKGCADVVLLFFTGLSYRPRNTSTSSL